MNKGTFCTVQSLQTPEEFAKNLSLRTMPQQKFKYLRWVWTDDKLRYDFYGVVHQDTFMICPYTLGKNFFTPVVTGHILMREVGSLCKYQVNTSPDMKKFYLFMYVMAILYSVALLINLIDPSSVYCDKILFYSWPVIWGGLMGVFTILNRHYVRRHQKTISERLEELAQSY